MVVPRFSGVSCSLTPAGKAKAAAEPARGARVLLKREGASDSVVEVETEPDRSSVEMFGVRDGGVLTPPAMSVGRGRFALVLVE